MKDYCILVGIIMVIICMWMALTVYDWNMHGLSGLFGILSFGNATMTACIINE